MEFERHCWAEIDLDALRHNFSYIQQTVNGAVCGVVKADAYGHGDETVAPYLQRHGAAAFAVSCLAEGVHLRHHGITKPILILGYADPAFAKILAENEIATAAFSTEYAETLNAVAASAGVVCKVHLKVDTGMGRIGFCARTDFERTIAGLEHCCKLPNLKVEGIFQHFAVADSETADNIQYTEEQHILFMQVVRRLQDDGFTVGTVHCANSAAQLLHPDWKHDMTRAGIILYGLNPSDEVTFPALRPVMTLKARITFIKELQPGQSVCYGRTYTADQPRRAATVCVGYADGYPRLLSGTLGGGVMGIHGKAAPVLGRVCMDQTVVDVTDIPEAKPGDEVIVFGSANAAIDADTADTIAAKTNTINYEITCGISRRVPRIYIENGKIVHVWHGLD